jgi:hypothetical protein
MQELAAGPDQRGREAETYFSSTSTSHGSVLESTFLVQLIFLMKAIRKYNSL